MQVLFGSQQSFYMGIHLTSDHYNTNELGILFYCGQGHVEAPEKNFRKLDSNERKVRGSY